MKWLALLILTVALAGCGDVTTSESWDVVAPAQAYHFAAGLVTNEDGSPRYRAPGTDGHASALTWLQDQANVSGWSVELQSFTGANYDALDLRDSSLEAWKIDCDETDAAERDGLQFTNVVARYDDPNSDSEILLGAHWESKENARDGGAVLGANDGASGVGVLLSLMRDYQPTGDVTVVFFDGEDGFEDCHPLAGSMYYARTMTDAPNAMILLDMVGDADAVFPREQRSTQSAPELQNLLWARGNQFLPGAFAETPRTIHDDHVPFIQEGVPSVDVIHYANGFAPYWHTSNDTMDNLDPDFMDQIQRIVQATVSDWFQMQNA